MTATFDFRLLWFAAALVACTPDAPPLNSDRIEQRFGNYGVEILAADAQTRVSCLYSEDPDGRTCRTIAVVEFERPLVSPATPVHRRILDGGSIGLEFRDAGWHIRKSHHRVSESPLPAELYRFASKMRVGPDARLATHRYRFEIRRDAGWQAYAAITEFHHPDYLSVAELTAIYVRD